MSAGDIHRLPPVPASPNNPAGIKQVNPRDDAGEESEHQRGEQQEAEEEEPSQEEIQDSYEGAAPENADVSSDETSALRAAATDKEKSEEEDEGRPHIDVQA